ncbi:hypothetical protein N665_0258s0018 [Sinapis alba]|nr:hypothetical protein N665_0258s0018 [Sinapis alba]
MVKEVIGLDVWPKLKEFVVGVIIKLKELDYTWSTKYVHHFLTKQLAIQGRHEIWSLLECLATRFSLYGFREITGLNCDHFDDHGVVLPMEDRYPKWKRTYSIAEIDDIVHEIYKAQEMSLDDFYKRLDDVYYPIDN